MIELILPYPPSLNRLYKVFRAGKGNQGRGVFGLSDKGLSYKHLVWRIVKEQKIQTITGRVALLIVAVMPDKRRRDIMNLEKIVSDALQYAQVFEDDAQIDLFHIERGDVRKPGELRVTIRERGAYAS